MRAHWRRGAVTFLTGCLVGPYGDGLPILLAAVVASALALALPAVVTVLVDRAIQRRAKAVAWVAGTALLLGIPLVWSAATPAVWQGYSSSAACISLLAEILLAPLAAAFVLGAVSMSAEPGTTPGLGAIPCALLAWAGIGMQNLLLLYLVPFGGALFVLLGLRAPINHGGGLGSGLVGLLFRGYFIFVLCVLYAIGFALASLTGLLGVALHRRLTRPQRVPRSLASSDVAWPPLAHREFASSARLSS